MLHADAEPIEGLEVLYTINFYAYEYDEVEKKNLTNPYTAVFKVVGNGQIRACKLHLGLQGRIIGFLV